MPMVDVDMWPTLALLALATLDPYSTTATQRLQMIRMSRMEILSFLTWAQNTIATAQVGFNSKANTKYVLYGIQLPLTQAFFHCRYTQVNLN